MNERIKELADCAFDDLENDPVIIFKPEDLKEFAELIIRECIDVCIALQDVPASEPRHCAQDIKIHFGIVDD